MPNGLWLCTLHHCVKLHKKKATKPVSSSGALALLQSTGAQSIRSQQQVQHQKAKSTQYRDQQLCYKEVRWLGMPKQAENHHWHTHTINQQLPYCTQHEQRCDQRLLCVGPHRGPLATPDGLQPLPGGWHNHEAHGVTCVWYLRSLHVKCPDWGLASMHLVQCLSLIHI